MDLKQGEGNAPRPRCRGRGARARVPLCDDRRLPNPIFGGHAMSNLSDTSQSRSSRLVNRTKFSCQRGEASSHNSDSQSQASAENESVKSNNTNCSYASESNAVSSRNGKFVTEDRNLRQGLLKFGQPTNSSGSSVSSVEKPTVLNAYPPTTVVRENQERHNTASKIDRKPVSLEEPRELMHGPNPCVVARKLSPAKQKETVLVTTNIYPLEVESRIVYRYDVRMISSRRDTSKERLRDLCKGDRDDSESTMRHHKCMLLLRRALEIYRLLNESGAYLYDLSSSLFTNEPLNKDQLPRLTISYEQMTGELQKIMGEVDVRIEITPCAENAHTFNIGDYRSSTTNDLNRQDHSLRQFFEILTNSSALQKGTHYAFGSGKLFMLNGHEFGLPEKPLSEGRTLLTGADKGIRFIEGSGSGIVPALVLDSKKAAFFDPLSLFEMVRSILMRNADPDVPFPKLDDRLFCEFRRKISDFVRDLRLEHVDNPKQSFIASGLSDKPVAEVTVNFPKKRDGILLLEYYRKQGIRLRPDLPAVRLTTPFGTTYFPIEVLRVSPRQRVPISKQTAWQMKEAIKDCSAPPTIRFMEISKNLAALDLSHGARYNPFMSAFGVRISLRPLKVEGHRRTAPKVQYLSSRRGTGITEVDNINANWRMTNKEYLVGAELGYWFILYDEERDKLSVMSFKEVLIRECRKKGMRLADPVVNHVAFENIERFFKTMRLRNKGRIFVMYMDSRDDTHDDLKLMEALYRIVTQHVHMIRVREAPKRPATLENIINKLNCKNFGQCYGVVPESFGANKWISTGKTLIIGYDVCHPEPQPKHERRLKLAPIQPSVLGISFNGAVCPETFIGDYAYQPPRQEQATGSILEERIFWILGLFQKNRGNLPDTVIITRDGVSEGQFKMVMEEEIEAIRSGIQNFSDKGGIPNYKPAIVCVIACKRHNKRFAIECARGYDNCLPMTVIDRDVTRPDVTEFFMQSHRVIKGTGKLPAYSMPVNEANFTMDEVQSLMMALCFTHQIVNQAISIPEPIYQADEWAKRGRNNFRAMMRRVGGRDRLPMLSKDEVDWCKVTSRLCYMNSELQLTRANA